MFTRLIFTILCGNKLFTRLIFASINPGYILTTPPWFVLAGFVFVKRKRQILYQFFLYIIVFNENLK